MQKRIWLLALVAAVLLAGSAAWADDGFYVIVGGGGVGIKITSLPYTISSPGLYYLGGNLSTGLDGDAITINADNVTLDLMGCSLTYTGAAANTNGVYLHGRSNVEIRNGAINGFYTGIYESSSSGAGHRVINIRANNITIPKGVGIYLMGNNHLVRGCTASHNTEGGIYLESGRVCGCVACDNSNYGIAIYGAGSLLLQNIANNSSSSGTSGFKFGVNILLLDGNGAGGNGTNYSPGGALTVWGVNAGD